MDGHFVDNISFGPSTIPAIKSTFEFKFDSHLMVSNPEKIIPQFINSGSEWISFHIETKHNILDNLKMIKNSNRKAGLVLNPDCPIKEVFPFLSKLDYVLLMSVFPGYGGQKFIKSTTERVRKLREKIDSEGCKCLIQVDGGINTSNIKELRQAGTDIFIVGTYLFNSNSIGKTMNELLNQINGE
jgi:ribulose-phosphate 3-epimerase